MRILLLGGTGQVGTALRTALPSLGQLIVPGRSEADLADPSSIARCIAGAGADIIVNAAAYTAVDRAEDDVATADRANHLALAQMGSLAGRALVVHYSSDYVFDGRKPSPYSEDDATAPLNVYGRTKRDGEMALAASGASYLIFRTSWVHSPGGNNFIRRVLQLAKERDELSVVDDQIGAPTSASLIATVTAETLAARFGGRTIPDGVYHLTASGAASWWEVARYAIKTAPQDTQLRTTIDRVIPIASADLDQRAKRPANSRLDTSRLSRALGRSLPDWRTDALETIQAASRA